MKTGFKNKPPLSGSLVHLQALINPTWLQDIVGIVVVIVVNFVALLIVTGHFM